MATFIPSASANAISPGGSGAPDVLAPAGTQIADTGTFTFTTGPFLSGTAREIVVQEATGTLDFIFAIHNNAGSADSLGRSTTTDFTGFSTDVGYTLAPINLLGDVGFVIPTSVDRSLGGDTVGFNFGPPLGFPPGGDTLNLVIETNAIYYTAGQLNFIDGGVAAHAAFAPTTAPEPASLALMGTGIVFCARLLRRKKKNAAVAITA